jgi:diadenosine tetraphosphate (Ap4A) HIT family hydrolase
MNVERFVAGCFSCKQAMRGAALPVRERIYDDGLWRVAHAFNSSLPGWLVLLPWRHVSAIAELTVDEAAWLGPLLHRLSQALHAVVGCPKTYVMQFAEAEGFSHVHFHVVPRMAGWPREWKGPRVFHFLGEDETTWVPTDEMDRIGLAVREYLHSPQTGEPRDV